MTKMIIVILYFIFVMFVILFVYVIPMVYVGIMSLLSVLSCGGGYTLLTNLMLYGQNGLNGQKYYKWRIYAA